MVRGWAHVAANVSPKVYIWLNDRVIRVCAPDVARPDVAESLGPNLLQTGFSVDISSELSRTAGRGSTRKVEVAATIDREGARHLANSPLLVPDCSLTLRSIHYQFPATLRAEFGRADAAAGFVGNRGAVIEIDSLATAISFQASIGRPLCNATASSLELSDPVMRDGNLRAAVETLVASRRAGHEDIDVSLRGDDAAAAQALRMPIDDLLFLMVPMLVAGGTVERVASESEGGLGSLASVALDLVERNAIGVVEPLLDALTPAIEATDEADAIEIWVRTLHALWNRGCLSMYARAAAPLFRSAFALDHLAGPHRACELPFLWERAVKIITGHLAPESEIGPLESTVAAVWTAANDDLATRLASRDPAVIRPEWARTVILPCLPFFARRRDMLRFWLGVELETACLRMSAGRMAAFDRVTAGSLLIEPLFQHVEHLFKNVSLRFSSELIAVFHDELQACFTQGTLMRAMVIALGDPHATILRDDALEQMAADVLVCGSESRRCHYGRLHAMNALATSIDTWRGSWRAERHQRSHLYSFEAPLKNRPTVFMAHSHPTLKVAMDQVSEDLTPLIENEGDAAFMPSEMVVFDGVDLASASTMGGLVANLAAAIGPAGQRGQTVIFAPWLSLGGADAYCAAMANAILTRTGRPPIICLTESGNTDGSIRLHPQVRVVDLSAMLAPHSVDQQAHALAMAISIVRPGTVLNFNSRLLWATLAKFHRRLTQETRYGCLFFCDDLDGEGVPHSYLRHHAHLFASGAMWAIADSVAYFERVARELSIAPARSIGIRFPPSRAVVLASTKTDYRARGTVLWCGRFDRQKRLDVLVALARSLPDVTFHVHGFPMLDSNADLLRALRACPNVRECGRYTSFSEIDVDEYDCLLMTTQWEGIPNILLEAGIRGLPVIAPVVGGVPETLGNDRGYTVSHFDSPRGYAEALRNCLGDRGDAAGRAARLMDYIRDAHSESALDEALVRLGY
jgi:hypothetical protein